MSQNLLKDDYSSSSVTPTISDESHESSNTGPLSKSEENLKKNNTSSLKVYFPLFCCVCVFLLFFGIFCLAISYILVFVPRGAGDEYNEALNVGGYHFHKYLWVKKSSEETKTFQSMKEINKFATYPMEHDVEVYPMLFDHEVGESSSEILGEGRKEYLCKCNLEEVKEYFDDDFSRRGITTHNPRRIAVVSSGLIIASAIAVLVMLYKTSEVQLRIFANNNFEAEEYASEEMTNRILSEVEGERGNPYWDEMEEDCRNCDKFKVKKLEEEVKRLRARTSENTDCEEVKKSESDPKDFDVKKCSALCYGNTMEERVEEPEKYDTFESCYILPYWEGNQYNFGIDDEEVIAKKSLRAYCEQEKGVHFFDYTFDCESVTIDVSYFTKQHVYKIPEICKDALHESFFDDFAEFCVETSGRDMRVMSCYDPYLTILQDDRFILGTS